MMKITPKQFRLVLLGLLILLGVIFLATASIGLKALSHKSQQLVAVKLKSKTADAQLTSLEQAKKQVDKYGYFNEVAQTVIPNDKDQAQAVLDIFQLANDSGISLANITFPASTLGVGAKSATSSNATSTALTQAKPVQGIKNLYSLELTITPQTGPSVPADRTVTYSKFLDFLGRIEHNRRTAQITQVSIQPQAAQDQSINFNLTVDIFIRPSK